MSVTFRRLILISTVGSLSAHASDLPPVTTDASTFGSPKGRPDLNVNLNGLSVPPYQARFETLDTQAMVVGKDGDQGDAGTWYLYLGDEPLVLVQAQGHSTAIPGDFDALASGAAGSGPAVSLTNYNNLASYMLSGAPANPTSNPALVAASIGGNRSGAAGGLAGAVMITNEGNIFSSVSNSMGILAHSIGGSASSSQNGGDANAVTVNNDGNITTGGEFTNGSQFQIFDTPHSPGIVARSIGAFGGSGGSDCGFLCFYGYGTNGGNGGNAGQINVTNTGNIMTSSEASQGILAISIGGGGGNAGPGDGLIASVGGGGGEGGQGHLAYARNLGQIVALNSRGIQAQSISGGGGDGGHASGVVMSLGGSGGDAAPSFRAFIENCITSFAQSLCTGQQGQISSFGSALFAQSVAGGGGAGGSTKGISAVGGSGASGANAGTATVYNSGTLLSTGAHHSTIHAQSVGGGGGHGGAAVSGGLNASVAIGGNGGSGGTGSDVGVYNIGNISAGSSTDLANFSHGIFAQSVGGGGGSAGNASSGSIGLGAAIAVSIGGKGGAGASAGEVTVNNCGFDINGACLPGTSGGNIQTFGSHSSGIFAQSVGGGGGAGGLAASGAMSNGAALAASLGGSGGQGGAGRQVTVNSQSQYTSLGQAANGAADITTGGVFSSGIFAQSVGGGGGSSGTSITATAGSVALSAAGGSGPFFQIGGLSNGGGVGNDAATVNVSSSSIIQTAGHHATGIVAQSVGGGGGHGGADFSGSASLDGSLSVGLGGAGGPGGTGGQVTLTTNALSGASDSGTLSSSGRYAIQTSGHHADGILAQSIGGGGGAGGTSVAGTLSANIAASLALGGSGGSGGVADKVSLTNNLSVLTSGSHAKGLVAQSIGGGGGNAGASIAASAGGRASFSAAGLTLGNSGGLPAGGNGAFGNAVSLTSNAQVTTQGDSFASAVVAQSIGGGGGHGGISGALSLASRAALSAALGGQGGTGNTAGAVTLSQNGGSVATSGSHSHGLLAQSIGGGGGAGGFALAGSGGTNGKAVSITIGGNGGVGGSGSNVTLNTTSGSNGGNGQPTSITVTGDHSNAILAQSIGGGGGHGAISASFSAGTLGFAQADVPSLNLGNKGGSGGTGGDVAVHTQAILSSSNASALVAQSIGGGGGLGGSKITGDFSFDPSKGEADLSLGASGVNGAAGAEAGNVSVDAGTGSQMQGAISASGDHATGIMAQSIGGGGGAGGWSFAARLKGGGEQPGLAPASAIAMGGTGGIGGAAGQVIVDDVGNITTNGINAQGVVAQSIGGGGGHGGLAISASGALGGSKVGVGAVAFAMGGSGGGGANAGAVQVTTATGSQISTNGHSASGILAQSVGGGGGQGGGALSVASAINANSFSIAHGGSGGAGGAPQTASINNITVGVAVNNNGQITTGSTAKSDDASAIQAQSVGGGGGSAGFTVSLEGSGGVEALDNIGASIALGGSGGAGNSGNIVNVASTGNLTTNGDRSSGIFAQSLGAGGGHAGLTFSADAKLDLPQHSLGGKDGANGDGGAITVNNTGTISTSGAQAHGAVAQSVGGGGGHSGISVSGTLTTSANIAMGLGGTGNATGAGGAVNLVSTGTVNLGGLYSVGLLAQSIGGGGGVAGVSVDKIAFGATPSLTMTAGGTQGIGGDVTVQSNRGGNPSLSTKGADSPGILAQSIAGGGGFSYFTVGNNPGNASLNGVVQLGAPSAGAAASGTVSVTEGNAASSINTQGPRSAAVIGQSITGGGGVINLASDGAFGAASTLGMSGASALAAAGAVTITSGSALTTQGDDSQAILAQSISGGGGLLNADSIANLRLGATGAQGSGNAGSVTVNATGPMLSTNGQRASVVVAQSIGGGGGVLSAAGSVSGGLDSSKIHVGGSNLTADAGAVTLTNSAGITAKGNQSHGLIAQSIGGGGGMVAANQVVSTNTLTPFSSANTQTTGNGGAVTLSNSGTISLSESGAIGIVAQSIGGGGGLFDGGNYGTSGPNLDIAWGGGSSSQIIGNAGNVTVANSANISAGIGILAQSAAGGGGAIVSSVFGAMAGGYGKGSAGSVSVSNQGTINATALGIAAAAMSGDQPQTQTLTVSTNGSVTAGSYGIMAQIAGTAPAAAASTPNLIVNVGQAGLTSQPTIKANTAVLMQTQGAGVLNNYGTIGDAANNYGAVFNNGSHTFNNYGTYTGAFGGNGRLTVNNQAGGVLNIGQYIINNQSNVPEYASVSGDLNNLGGTVTATPGRVSVLNIQGNFTQSATGTLMIDFDPKQYYDTQSNPFDSINVAGSQVSLKGNIGLNIMNPRYLGATGSLFVDLGRAVIDWGSSASSDVDLNINFNSLVLTFAGKLNTQGGYYEITYNTDFDVQGLDPSVAGVGKHINTLLLGNKFYSEDDDAVLLDVISQTSTYGVFQLYSDMIPSGYSNSISAALGYTSNQMAGSMSHLQNMIAGNQDYDDSEMNNSFGFNPANPRILIAYQGDDITDVVGNLPVREARNSSVWFAPVRMDVSKRDAHGISRTKHTGGTIGFDYRLSHDWLAGFSLGYAQSQTGYSTQLGQGDIDNLTVSAHTIRRFGSSYVSGAVSVVDHDISHQRHHSLGGGVSSNNSNFSNLSLGASLEVGTQLRLSALQVQPYLRLNLYNMQQDDAQEESTSNFALSLKEHTLESYVSELGVRLSGRWNLDNGQLVPSLAIGWRHELTDGETALPTRFNVATDEVFHYNFAHTPSDHGSASLGLSYNSLRGNSFGVSAYYEEGGRHRASGIEGKLLLRF